MKLNISPSLMASNIEKKYNVPMSAATILTTAVLDGVTESTMSEGGVAPQ